MLSRSRVEERIYKSAWHVLMCIIGVYELRTHRTRLAKVLAVGMIAFHIDAAISDALDSSMTLSRFLLEKTFPSNR